MKVVAWVLVAIIVIPPVAILVARIAAHRTWAGVRAELASWLRGE